MAAPPRGCDVGWVAKKWPANMRLALCALLVALTLVREGDAHAVYSSSTITAAATLDANSPTVVYCDTASATADITVTLPDCTGVGQNSDYTQR